MENYVKNIVRHFRGHTHFDPRQEAIDTLKELSETSTNPPLVTKVFKMMRPTEDLEKKMRCSECGILPLPSKLYICGNGHIFCMGCAKDRGLKYDFKCRVDKKPTTKSKDISEAETTETDEEEPRYFEVCQERIRHGPPDPIYLSMWYNTVWPCPNRDKGCTAEIPSKEFSSHVKECKRVHQQLKKDKEKCDSSTNAYLEKICPINGCEKSFGNMKILEHLALEHEVEIVEVPKCGNTGYFCIVEIPDATIEGQDPHYVIIKGCAELFLLGVEPVKSEPANEDYLAIWLRVLVNFDTDAHGNKTVFSYDFMLNNFRRQNHMKLEYSNDKMREWENSMEDIITEKDCMLLPSTLIKIYFQRNKEEAVAAESSLWHEIETDTRNSVLLHMEMQHADSEDYVYGRQKPRDAEVPSECQQV
ncbi:unnamed protein product [Orchesella dallaii]|uniref:RING-type E3 ubiquitin transferase n=1 Tax=Orchesella dallaii TaxID=48710 RepID=A0ABP1QJX6_9HEXA